MSFFSNLFRLEPLPPMPRTGIRSATGLSRGAIADYYRRNGLFGRDSDLTIEEQRAVRSRLGKLPGVPDAAPVDRRTARSDARLQDIADYVDALIAGRDVQVETARLWLWGVSAAAQSEIERTVHNVQDIFGPRTLPAKSEVREAVISNTTLARAA